MSGPGAAVLGALCIVMLVAGCGRPTGDLGRPQPSVFHDRVLPLVGAGAAGARGEPVSGFMLTDREREMRSRAWRLVMPVHRRDFAGREQTEWVRSRVWPDSAWQPDPSSFYRHLRADGFSSSVARYEAIGTEIAADIGLIGPFYEVVRHVYAADRQRLEALWLVDGLTVEEEADVLARIYENRRVAEWAVTGLRWRVESYRYALERTRIEVPEARARRVAGKLALLEARVATLAAGVAALDYDLTSRLAPGAPGARHADRPLTVKH